MCDKGLQKKAIDYAMKKLNPIIHNVGSWPYNPLDKQIEYDKNTGEVLKWNVQPHNNVDEIAAYHDICYDMGKDKGDCDRKMVEQLDEIPYGQISKMGQVARTIINNKQKLGLGVSKNGKSS